MIKLEKRSIRLSVTPIVQDLFWITSTVDVSLKTPASASETMSDISHVRDL